MIAPSNRYSEPFLLMKERGWLMLRSFCVRSIFYSWRQRLQFFLELTLYEAHEPWTSFRWRHSSRKTNARSIWCASYVSDSNVRSYISHCAKIRAYHPGTLYQTPTVELAPKWRSSHLKRRGECQGNIDSADRKFFAISQQTTITWFYSY